MGKGGSVTPEPSSLKIREHHQKNTQANSDRIVTLDELSKHSTADNCWILISGKVYDVTKWLKVHPGGERPISDLGGKDATDIFQAFHPTSSRKRLPQFLVGVIEEENLSPEVIEHRKMEKMFQENGTYETNYWFYYRLGMILFVLFCTAIYGVVGFKSTVIHMLSAILLGLVFNQFSFIGHDTGHNGITKNRKIDHLIGLLVGNTLTGISIGWWKSTHNVHHVFPNSLDYDPDIQHVPILAVSEGYFKNLYSHFHQRAMPFDAAARFLVAFQHYTYLPLMAVARVNLYIQSILYLPQSKDKLREFICLFVYFSWFSTLVSTLPSLAEKVAFVLLCHAAAGILHVQICNSHFSLQFMIGTPDKYKWSKTQLVSTMDIDCPTWMDWFHGGLQFQIEHHLFPRLPRHNLRKCVPLVKDFCKRHGLPYASVPFFEAVRLTIEGLRNVAKKSGSLSKPELAQSCNVMWDALNAQG